MRPPAPSPRAAGAAARAAPAGFSGRCAATPASPSPSALRGRARTRGLLRPPRAASPRGADVATRTGGPADAGGSGAPSTSPFPPTPISAPVAGPPARSAVAAGAAAAAAVPGVLAPLVSEDTGFTAGRPAPEPPVRAPTGDTTAAARAATSPALERAGADDEDDDDERATWHGGRPLLLRWLADGPAELRALSFAANASVLAAAAVVAGAGLFASLSGEGGPLAGVAATASAAAAAAPPGASPLVDLLSAPSAAWAAYSAALSAHPGAFNAALAGLTYLLGDATAQAFEGRGLTDVDAFRTGRSALLGAALWAPAAGAFYEGLDRFVYVTPGFQGGDAWWALLFKVGVDQTLFAGAWTAAYLGALAALRGGAGGPRGVGAAVANGWWDVLRAGWRVWPAVGLVTFGCVPLPHRVAFAALAELGWVTALGAYADTRRAAAARRAAGVGRAAVAADAAAAAGAASAPAEVWVAAAEEGGDGADGVASLLPPPVPPSCELPEGVVGGGEGSVGGPA